MRRCPISYKKVPALLAEEGGKGKGRLSRATELGDPSQQKALPCIDGTQHMYTIVPMRHSVRSRVSMSSILLPAFLLD